MNHVLQAPYMLGPDGPLARLLPGYECRDAQLRMAALVEDTLAHQGIALCEAGTGTGKTLSYLVPALLSGQRVVVSTGTKTLQDQIMRHDVPLLAQLPLGEFKAVSMKGLSNYLCLRRYHAFMAGRKAAANEHQRYLPLLQAFAERTATGERDELSDMPAHVASALFAEVQSGPEIRIGPRCEFFEACHVTRMRRQAAEAQLIVVNHHLLFADLALKGNHGTGVIPAYDALILDEAHLIEDIATEFFGTSVSNVRIETLVRDADRTLSATAAVLSAQRALRDVGTCSLALFSGVRAPAEAEGARVPLPAGAFSGPLADATLALDDALAALCGVARGAVDEGQAVAQLVRRIEQLRADLALFGDGPSSAHVLWTAHTKRSVTLGRSPVDVGGMLREQLYYRNQATVFTSATLSTGGDFTFIKERLGIDFEVDQLALPSPFRYEDCAALYLPRDVPDYRTAGFEQAAVQHIAQLVALTGGGALVLCTSLRAMRALHRRCRPRLAVPVYVQGEAPNAELLSRLRETGNAVLFATASFWQGVDVPGAALRLVIIDKLPFDVPTDPLVRARCERLQVEGRSPFIRYLVPAAALTLKQGFGRLIRKRTDRGIVAVLDRRLTAKGYGKVFLRSLPPARHCTTFDEVARFWEEG